jgi:hypothetical protein
MDAGDASRAGGGGGQFRIMDYVKSLPGILRVALVVRLK